VMRIILGAAGLAALLPYEIFDMAEMLNIVGVAVGIAIFAFEKYAVRGNTPVGAEAP